MSVCDKCRVESSFIIECNTCKKMVCLNCFGEKTKVPKGKSILNVPLKKFKCPFCK